MYVHYMHVVYKHVIKNIHNRNTTIICLLEYGYLSNVIAKQKHCHLIGLKAFKCILPTGYTNQCFFSLYHITNNIIVVLLTVVVHYEGTLKPKENLNLMLD